MYVTDIQIEGEGAALNVTIPQVVMGELENLSRTSVDVKPIYRKTVARL